MKISYAVCVCNESRELYSLISFLKKVKDPEDEINILIDTAHVTKQVLSVIDYFKDDIVTYERAFDGNFATHRNYHISKCSGDYIFIIDPDEMPQQLLIRNIKPIVTDTGSDLIVIPRINICPGFTEEWLHNCKFTVNENGWINWPDNTCRIFKNCPEIKYGKELHETIIGYTKAVSLQADPHVALWHIKSVEKQDNRWNSDGTYKVPDSDDNLYDNLM